MTRALPAQFPPLLVGVTVRLSQEVASAALATVPRLQRKHYEMIPRSLTELEFFLSFFSHVSAIVAQNCPGALDPSVAEGEGSWRGVDQADGTNSFDAAWQALSAERRAHLAELAGRDSDALLQPNPRAPPAFPPLPLGMQCFVDENAATAALAAIPGLQYKHCAHLARSAHTPSHAPRPHWHTVFLPPWCSPHVARSFPSRSRSHHGRARARPGRGLPRAAGPAHS